MTECSATVRNAHGIHCRPSTAIATAVAGYPGRMSVRCADQECDPRSIMELMGLGLEQGEEVRIRIEGPEEEDRCRQLVELFETHFDFPPREAGA